jgi:hypothetical protein
VTTKHDFTEPQPEICDSCGTWVGGARLRVVLGKAVCDTTNTCMMYRDEENRLLEENSFPTPPTVGTARIYPAGAGKWAE